MIVITKSVTQEQSIILLNIQCSTAHIELTINFNVMYSIEPHLKVLIERGCFQWQTYVF